MTLHSASAHDTATELASDGAPAVIVFLLVVVGLLVLLVYVVWRQGANRRRDSAPTRDELPTPPDRQSHVESRLEPDEIDPEQGHQTPGRLTPHEMHGYGNMGSRPVAEPPERDGDDDTAAPGDRRPGA
ncbi:DUF6479 family protein [Streptomyces sp. NPDC005805]|uniref:DUF6479 family protein n=1 Tax=Streptomyces sp. NPDC005805 TaxID=3157068 RepID=UPI0033F54AF2